MLSLTRLINNGSHHLHHVRDDDKIGISHSGWKPMTVSWSDVLQNEYKEEHLSPFNTRQYDNIMDIVFEYEKTGLSPRIDIEDL